MCDAIAITQKRRREIYNVQKINVSSFIRHNFGVFSGTKTASNVETYQFKYLKKVASRFL